MAKENRAQNSHGLEVRTVTAEVRTEEQSGQESRRVVGFGAVYDRETELWPGVYEIIRQGALKESINQEIMGIRERSIKCYINHDAGQILSTTRSDPPLVVEDREEGVYYSAEIPNTSYGKDLIENLLRKNVSGSSFAFTIPPGGDKWTEDEDGAVRREITEAYLYELGPVCDPAYASAPSNLRTAKDSWEEHKQRIQEQRDAEQAEEQRKKEKVDTEQKRLEQRKEDAQVVKNILLGGNRDGIF